MLDVSAKVDQGQQTTKRWFVSSEQVFCRLGLFAPLESGFRSNERVCRRVRYHHTSGSETVVEDRFRPGRSFDDRARFG